MKHFALLSLVTITLTACTQTTLAENAAVHQKNEVSCAERCASGKFSGKQHCSHVHKTEHQQCHRHDHHGHHSQSSHSQSSTIASSRVRQIYQQYIDIPTAGENGTGGHAHCQKSYDADGKQKPCCEHHAKAQCHQDDAKQGNHQCCATVK